MTSPPSPPAPSVPRLTSSNASEDYRFPPGLKRPLHAYVFKAWVKLGSPILLFEYLLKTYGNIACYRFMGTLIVFINDPEYIREILVTQASSFVKERTVRRMKILLGEGLITSDDPIHMRQRKIAAPAFHRQRIAAYGDQIVACARNQSEEWSRNTQADPLNPQLQEVDISAASMKLSLEIVARTLFDTEVTADIRSINDEVNTIMNLYNFIVAFPRIESFLHLPIPGIIKFRRSKARLDAVVDRLILEHREAAARGEPDKGDLLSMLMASRYEPDDAKEVSGGHNGVSGEQEGMSDEQVRDEVLTIFLAGYETVANGLAWTWYLLSQNPEAEARLHAELDNVLGTGVERRLPTLADYADLQYTEQVFAESMRLYPPAWAMGRMSTAPVELGPYRIPAGAHFFFSQYIMGRDAQYFPDPLRFDPDRFTPKNKAARAKFTSFPFGGGRRQCIGESFAWMEGVFSIATIAQRWRMIYLGVSPPEVQAKITLRPKDPLMMRLVPR
ncbi:MAG: cytochrome P450 [Acidobacteriota bacterium]|nr:cytochrome P450 [Acidobacteriota bacterium]